MTLTDLPGAKAATTSTSTPPPASSPTPAIALADSNAAPLGSESLPGGPSRSDTHVDGASGHLSPDDSHTLHDDQTRPAVVGVSSIQPTTDPGARTLTTTKDIPLPASSRPAATVCATPKDFPLRGDPSTDDHRRADTQSRCVVGSLLRVARWLPATVLLAACSVAVDSEPTATTTAPMTVENTVAPETTVAPSTSTTTSSTTTSTTTTAPAPRELGIMDFWIDLFETERKCFGSAGALVTVEPELSLLTADDTDGRTFLIVYEIIGGEDGPQRFNIEVDESGSYSFRPEMISTETCDAELIALITAVRER